MQKLLDRKETAEILGISVRTLEKLMSEEGKAPNSIKVGNKIKFSEGAINDFIEGLK